MTGPRGGRRRCDAGSSLRPGTSGRTRLSVFRSSKHIHAQLIDDEKGVTVVAASSLEKTMRENAKDWRHIAAAKAVR